MKLNVILENDKLSIDDIKSMLGKEKQEYDEKVKQFEEFRNTLSRKDIALLYNMVKSQKYKKSVTKGIPEETLDKLSSLGLIDNNQRLTSIAKEFLQWVSKNPSRETDWVDKRADAQDALTRGHLKRDNAWTPSLLKQGRKIYKNLNAEEKHIVQKLYNRFFNPSTRNLTKSWKDIKPEDVKIMQQKGILDDNAELTDKGEFAVQYYMVMKDDPDGIDRVSRNRRVGNYGTAQKRREKRTDKITR